MSTHGSTPAHGAPGGHSDLPTGGGVARTTYQEVQDSPEFAALRRRFRRFVFPMTGFFLVWYFTYVLLADFAPGFMSTRIGGSNITVGLLFGLGQFVTTFAITTAYVRWANKHFDPEAEALREHIEGQAALGGAQHGTATTEGTHR